MNANLKLIVPAVLMSMALAACSSTGSKPKAAEKAKPAAAQQVPEPQTVTVDSIDTRKEVAYKCSNGNLNVMYGMKGNDVVVAQAKYNNQLTPVLRRVVGAQERNAFWAQNIGWSTAPASAANVDKVNGNMLTIRQVQQVNNQPTVVDAIVVKACVLDKAETAKLNKAAAPAKKASAKKAAAKK